MIASKRYGILVPMISQEPNTTKHVEREVSATQVTQQFLEAEAMGVTYVPGAPPVRVGTGLFQPGDSVPLRPIGSFDVLAIPLSGSSSPILWVGPFSLEAGRDYVPGGGVAATATAIAAAISNIRGYDAIAVGATVSIQGPEGATGLPLYATYSASVQVFSFTYTEREGFLGYNTSPIFPIEVT